MVSPVIARTNLALKFHQACLVGDKSKASALIDQIKSKPGSTAYSRLTLFTENFSNPIRPTTNYLKPTNSGQISSRQKNENETVFERILMQMDIPMLWEKHAHIITNSFEFACTSPITRNHWREDLLLPPLALLAKSIGPHINSISDPRLIPIMSACINAIEKERARHAKDPGIPNAEILGYISQFSGKPLSFKDLEVLGLFPFCVVSEWQAFFRNQGTLENPQEWLTHLEKINITVNKIFPEQSVHAALRHFIGSELTREVDPEI